MISVSFLLLTCNYEEGLVHDGQERKKPVCKTLMTVLLGRWQWLSGTLQVMVKQSPSLQSPFLGIRSVELLSIRNVRAGRRSYLAILGPAGCVTVTQIS